MSLAVAPHARRKYRRRTNLTEETSSLPEPKEADDASEDGYGNLNWLLNFKLDSVVKAPAAEEPPETAAEAVPTSPVRKPPYTYTELIERALRERGELTVSAIYQWISERYSYYKATDERWKNSVRHNLSINPHFRKGARAPHKAGHLWTLDAAAMDLLPARSHSPAPEYANYTTITTMTVQDINDTKVLVFDEAAVAAANIMKLDSDSDFFIGASAIGGVREAGNQSDPDFIVPELNDPDENFSSDYNIFEPGLFGGSGEGVRPPGCGWSLLLAHEHDQPAPIWYA